MIYTLPGKPVDVSAATFVRLLESRLTVVVAKVLKLRGNTLFVCPAPFVVTSRYQYFFPLFVSGPCVPPSLWLRHPSLFSRL